MVAMSSTWRAAWVHSGAAIEESKYFMKSSAPNAPACPLVRRRNPTSPRVLHKLLWKFAPNLRFRRRFRLG